MTSEVISALPRFIAMKGSQSISKYVGSLYQDGSSIILVFGGIVALGSRRALRCNSLNDI